MSARPVPARRTVPLAAVVVALAAACGSRTGLLSATNDPPESGVLCGPSTCPGCCDDAGACQPGNLVSACGLQGLRCVACNARYERCEPDPANLGGQVCFSPCNPNTCGGRCCLPTGTCVVGMADDACGSVNVLCEDCTASGKRYGTNNGVRACIPN